MFKLCLVVTCLTLTLSWGQTGLFVTSSEADLVLRGNYDPSKYKASKVVDDIAVIAKELEQRISPDSLESFLTTLTSFHNRNTGADTNSSTRGMGAARNWIYKKFQEFSARSENRLLPSYFQFRQTVCGMGQHRNVVAVLPGRLKNPHEIYLVMGHMDSRCQGSCDITCRAHGADDDGSGTVLTMELARVLSKYTFDHTLVFMTNTGEEQGTYGANAFALYTQQQKLPIVAIQNNDVSGNIICGSNPSPPGCTGSGSLDSTNIRIFSASLNFSLNKSLARFIKENYDKWIRPTAKVKMNIRIMDPTDRTGRGGDHEPFSERGYPAIRITENNENMPTRQHTTNDIIGDDTNNDGKIDRYYVNFNYLARNTLINAMGLVSGASSLQVPDFNLTENSQRFIQVDVTKETSPNDMYLVGIRRSGTNAFEAVYTIKGTQLIVPGTQSGTTYYVAVAAWDSSGRQSRYTQEKRITASRNGPTSVSDRNRLIGKAFMGVKNSNSTVSNLELILYSNPSEPYAVILTDLNGEKIKGWVTHGSESGKAIKFNLDGVSPGTYFLRLEAGGRNLQSQLVQVMRR